MTSERVWDVERNYERIRENGYVIDVRAAYPILIKGLWARKFDNWHEALNQALYEISSKKVND